MADPIIRGEREPYWVMGGVIDVKLDAAATGGAFTLISIDNPAGGGVPPHVHEKDDETVVMIEGEMECMVAGQTHPFRPGDVVFIPRGVVHAFTAGASGARAVAITSPGGAEVMLRQGAPPKTSAELPAGLQGPPDEAAIGRMMAGAAAAGLSFLPPES